MKSLIKIANNYLARFVAISSFIYAISSALKEFGVIDFPAISEFYFWIFLIASIVISITITYLLKDFKFSEKNLNKPRPAVEDEITRHLYNRIGSSRSLIKYENDEDNTHRFSAIKRFDILDYTLNNYQSIRILQGINSSKISSAFICYCESTEYKVAFNDIVLRAYDVISGKKLLVECCNAPPTEKLCTHSFRIQFDKPLEPGQTFNIVYYISFPHELDCLSSEREIMTISLIRIKRKPFANLSFHVLLNFEPELVRFYEFNHINDKTIILPLQNQTKKINCNRNALGVSEDLIDKLGVNSEKEYYMTGIDISKPKSPMYIIEYTCSCCIL